MLKQVYQGLKGVLSYSYAKFSKQTLKPVSNSVRVTESEVPTSVLNALKSESSRIKVSDEEMAKLLSGPSLEVSPYDMLPKFLRNPKAENFLTNLGFLRHPKEPRKIAINDLPLDVKNALYTPPQAEVKRYVYI